MACMCMWNSLNVCSAGVHDEQKRRLLRVAAAQTQGRSADVETARQGDPTACRCQTLVFGWLAMLHVKSAD